MQTRVTCSAQRLSLLSPPMIQSVVEANVFQIGTQYFSEGRVRITEADEHQINSLVFGIQGIHEQTLRLGDGHLTSKCSCSSSEHPLCRHATAALLEYFRRAQSAKAQVRVQDRDVHEVQEVREVREARPAIPPPPQAKKTSGLDIRLGEITAFIEWLQEGVRTMEAGGDLPVAPPFDGEAMEWVKALQSMEERRRTSQDKQAALETDLQHRDVQLVRLTQQLQASMQEAKGAMQEAKDAKTTCESLEREVDTYRGKLAGLLDQAKEFDRFNHKMKNLAEELVKNASNMDDLAASFKEVSTALQGQIPSTPHIHAA
jgi:uncharacterized protein YoxC